MATADKLDMSLDDIIKQTKKVGRGGRGRGRGRGGVRRGTGAAGAAATSGSRYFAGRRGRGAGGFGGNIPRVARGGVQKRRGTGTGTRTAAYTRGQINSRWQHDLFRGELYRAAGVRDNTRQGKLLISNLDFGVNDSDIQELFTEFGPLRRAAVHYDRSGRSLGTAEVMFDSKADAVKALQQYNNVPLDGRPMKIQLVTDAVSQASGGGGSRPNTASGRGASNRSFGNRQSSQGRGNPGRGGRGRGRGRGGRGGGGGRGGQGGGNMTKEQLDAQLDAYKMDIN